MHVMFRCALACALFAWGQQAAAQPHLDPLSARMLAAHNRERAQIGVPPMTWDPELARSAMSYGPALAAAGALVHSPRASRPGQRENLARGSRGRLSVEYLIGMWTAERRMFVPGRFPNVSRSGNWLDVAHYTQMVWRTTTRVGCAIYASGGWDYLICRYSPPGNKDGHPVY